jgi:hypothetical protein
MLLKFVCVTELLLSLNSALKTNIYRHICIYSYYLYTTVMPHGANLVHNFLHKATYVWVAMEKLRTQIVLCIIIHFMVSKQQPGRQDKRK